MRLPQAKEIEDMLSGSYWILPVVLLVMVLVMAKKTAI